MFADKARSLPKRFRGSTLVGYSLTHKHYTRLNRLARDKLYNLFGPFISDKKSL
jgi:hypothetical protein